MRTCRTKESGMGLAIIICPECIYLSIYLIIYFYMSFTTFQEYFRYVEPVAKAEVGENRSSRGRTLIFLTCAPPSEERSNV